MKTFLRYLAPAVLATFCSLAHPHGMRLTTNLPDCRMPLGRMLPDKYYKLAQSDREFRWVQNANLNDRVVSGAGWQRVDGSSINDWFTFYRGDLNNDGYCDWFVDMSAPLSSGGDRDSINTIYLGTRIGWNRVGATVPDTKPDALGLGQTVQEQDLYLFGEDIAVVHDAASKVNYLVTAFYDRHVQRDFMPGYRIFDWDSKRMVLRLLDKWRPGSSAAVVYAFFKEHGARLPQNDGNSSADSIERFNPDLEMLELAHACNPESPQRLVTKFHGAISPHLLARCKR